MNVSHQKLKNAVNGLVQMIRFYETIHKKIPKPLKYCEELFDKDVLEIEKLVKDIGDLNPLIHKERKKKFLCDDSNIISDFLLNLIKTSNVMDLFHYNTTIMMRNL